MLQNVSQCGLVILGKFLMMCLLIIWLVLSSVEWSVDHYRVLGVVVDAKLKFHQHVRSVVGKAGGMMGNLLRSTICLSEEFMFTLFVTHIRPIIDYCSTVWNVGYL